MPTGGVLDNRRVGHRNRPLDPRNPFAQSLVGWWRMNEGAGNVVRDWSGQNNHGQMVNMDPATDWQTGPDGWAPYFDGVSTYMSLGTGPSIDGTGNFSITLCFRIAFNADEPIWLISQRNGGWDRTYRVWESDSDITAYFWSFDGTWGLSTSGVDFTDGWHTLTFIRRNTVGELWADGIKNTENGGWIYALDGNIGTYVGINKRDGGNYHEGHIDYITKYSRALSASEIKQLYHNPDLPLWTPRQGVSLAGIVPGRLPGTRRTTHGRSGPRIYRG